MQIFFNWNVATFSKEEQTTREEGFRGDLKTLFPSNPKEAHVYINQPLPFQLNGSIKNEAGKVLCTFTCDWLNNNTTTYDFE